MNNIKLIFSKKELKYLDSLLQKEVENNEKCKRCSLYSEGSCFFAVSCLSNNMNCFCEKEEEKGE